MCTRRPGSCFGAEPAAPEDPCRLVVNKSPPDATDHASAPNHPPREAEARHKRPRRPNRLLLLAENPADSTTPSALDTTRDAPRQAVAPPTPSPRRNAARRQSTRTARHTTPPNYEPDDESDWRSS